MHSSGIGVLRFRLTFLLRPVNKYQAFAEQSGGSTACSTFQSAEQSHLSPGTRLPWTKHSVHGSQRNLWTSPSGFYNWDKRLNR